MDSILEILGLMALSGVKFMLAPGTTMLAGYGFMETVLITTAGGTIGVFVFYYAGEFIFCTVRDWINKRRKNKKVRKTFSRTNRLIVKTKLNYGLLGLAVITPTLLSIPLGSMIAARFFRYNRLTLPALVGSVIIWSILISGVISLGMVNFK